MTALPAGALEACPFCGGEPRAVYGRLSEVHYVTCDNDDCKTNGPSADSESAAIAAWNRRPALLAALRLREACEFRIRAWRAGGPNLIEQQHVIYDACAADLARVLEESATGDEAALP